MRLSRWQKKKKTLVAPTYRFVGFGADIKHTLELVNHAWNEPALQVRKVRDYEKRACVLFPLSVERPST